LPFRCNAGKAVIPHKSDILVVGGVLPGCCYKSDAHVFNVETGQMTYVGSTGTG